jgi:aspartyl-tRNA(Asn)/glutamyl-tRNA(Gln) amidotransferase subunit C
MPITRSDVEKIAELARLELTATEADSLTDQLGSILSYIEKLNELDTSGIPPMSHCATAADDRESAWRPDIAQPPIGQDTALANAPDPDAGYFRVPKVIG